LIVRRKTREVARKYVHRKLIFRLRRFALTGTIIYVIIGYDVFKGIITFPLSFTGILLGFLVGKFMGRYANVHWHEETDQVISKLDRAGIIVLIVYLLFSFSRRWFFGHWIHGPALTVLDSYYKKKNQNTIAGKRPY
jgi:hypothetical protein